MMLANVSAHQPRTSAVQKPQYHYPHPHQQPPPPPPRATTPVIKQELTRQQSPEFAPPAIPLVMPSQAAHSSPIKNTQPTFDLTQEASHPGPNGIAPMKEPEAPAKTTPRLSTHRIMDILNDDQEVPVPRARESQPPAQAPSTPSMREATTQQLTPSRSDALRVDAMVNREEPPVDQALMDALSGGPSNPTSSPPSNPQPWQQSSVPPPPQPPSTVESDEALRRRDPLQKIRELLDRKAREHGREPPDRSHYRTAPLPSFRIPHPYPPTSTQERPEVAGYDPTRPSTGLYDAHPGTSHVNLYRRQSQDQTAQQWEHERRMSGSQQPTASPYQANAAQPYHGEHNRPGPTPPTHQSPYAPPSGPSSSLPLPPKPPGPPPSAPINFRFAHYDPAPPRQPYPPQSPSYPPASHPQQGPPPPHYAPAYGAPPPTYQGNYVPPPGSFQAPPPPSSSMGPTPYPPLKIYQYGGQPILPANIAPPPQSGPPQNPYIGQQSGPQAAFSPTQQYEGEGGRGDPASRPRRQYRSYHAPGTQFRSWQGPGEVRRRGG
jgi:hypothetical protein